MALHNVIFIFSGLLTLSAGIARTSGDVASAASVLRSALGLTPVGEGAPPAETGEFRWLRGSTSAAAEQNVSGGAHQHSASDEHTAQRRPIEKRKRPWQMDEAQSLFVKASTWRAMRSAVSAAPTMSNAMSFGATASGPNESFTPLSPAALASAAHQPCGGTEIADWNERGHVPADLLATFKDFRKDALIYVDDGWRSCVAEDLSRRGPHRTALQPNAQVLTLVRVPEREICRTEPESRELHLFRFPVEGAMQMRSFVRNFVSVWPIHKCKASAPCPVVVSLHGHDEHDEPDKLAKWGLLSYAQRDADCLRTLGSVLIFPQLLTGESWVRDGEQVFIEFVLPLLDQMGLAQGPRLNTDKIALVGYSEGAIGALQGAMLYPHIFSVVAAASPSLTAQQWKHVRVPRPSHSTPWKLKVVMVALGVMDGTAPQPENLQHILSALDRSGVSERSALHVRLYAKLKHIDTWETTFNRWSDFHDVIWRGNFDRMAAPWDWYRELVATVIMMVVASFRCFYGGIPTGIPGTPESTGRLAADEPIKVKAAFKGVAASQVNLPSRLEKAPPPGAQASRTAAKKRESSLRSILPSSVLRVLKSASSKDTSRRTFEAVVRTVSPTVQEVKSDMSYLTQQALMACFPDSNACAIVQAGSSGAGMSYTRLREIVNTQASALLQLVGPADSARVATVIPQGPEALTCLLTCFAAGISRIAPLDPKMSQPELLRLLLEPNLALTAVLAVTGSAGAAARAAAEEAGLQLVFIRTGNDCSFQVLRGLEARRPVHAEPGAAVDEVHGPALALCTSGTTGRPQWVCQPAEAILTGARLIAGSLELTNKDCTIEVMPLHHIGGICCSFASLVSGGCLVCAEAFEPEAFRSWLSRGVPGNQKPTWYYAAPTIHHAVAAAVAERKPNHNLRLVRSGAAAMPAALKEKLEQVLGCLVLPTYSMSECMPICATIPSGAADTDSTSVGVPIGPSLRIADAAGKAVPYGTLGEVMIHQPGLVTPGYLGNDASRSGARASDGWLRTGDLGKIDGEGRVMLTGRSKEVINRAGETLAPSEVEDALLRLPGVSDAMAFAVPSEEFGEVVGAIIVPERGAANKKVSLAELWKGLALRVSRPLWPELLIYMDTIPKGRTGKKLRVGFANKLDGIPAVLTLPSAYTGELLDTGSVKVTERETGLEKKARAGRGGEPEEEPGAAATPEGQMEFIWSEVLGLDGPIDWDASLWASGGRSSQLAAVVARTRAAFGLPPERLPLTVAMSKPTLRGLFSVVQVAMDKPSVSASRTSGTQSSCLVPIGEEAGEDRPVVLMLAGRAKSCLRFGPLAAAFPELRFFGIERPGRGSRASEPVAGLQASEAPGMAKDMAAEIVEKFGSTRLVLAGPCMGSLWAFALAVEIERAGGRPCRLVSFDGGCPSQEVEPFTKQASFIREFLSTQPSEEEVAKFMKALTSEAEAFDDEASASLLNCWLWDNEAYVALVRHFAPKSGEATVQVRCPIRVYRATEDVDQFMRHRDDKEWAMYTTTGPFTYVEMKCRHFELMSNIMSSAQHDAKFKAEMQDVLTTANVTDDDSEGSDSICPWQRFARLDKASLAIVDEDEEEVTVEQLQRSAIAMAGWLRSRGVDVGKRVLLLGVPSRFCLTAQLALMHCGATAVPVNEAENAEYLQQVAEAASCTHLLCREVPWGSSWWGVEVLVAQGPHGPASTIGASHDHMPAAFVSRKAAAAVLFSSGTTGAPKGVVQSYGSVMDMAADTAPQSMPRLWKGAIGWIANFVLPPALVGQALLVVPAHLQLDPFSFRGLRTRHGVDRMTMSPSELNSFCAAPGCLNDLAVVTCMAETLPVSLVHTFYHQYPAARLEETYASSEVQGSNAFLSTEVPRGATATGRFRIRPGQSAVLVDPQDHTRKIVTPGETGELLLSPTAVGYLNEAHTQKRFISNPFGTGKLFRTGDLCKFVDMETVQLVGRVDFQVKVSGQLVALEQVEAAADSIEGVRQAAARTIVRSSGTTAVALYMVTDGKPSGLTEEVAKQKLARLLPAHAVPAFVGFLPAIPLLPNGKKDRQALPEPEEGEEVTDSMGMVRAVGMRTAKEHRMAQSLFGFAALALPVLHWVPHVLPGESPAAQTLMQILMVQASHLSVPLLVWVVGFSDGRAKRAPKELMTQCKVVFGLYLLMAWPFLFSWSQGVATFHRWSCIAFVVYRLGPLLLGKLRLPPWSQVLFCCLLAPVLGRQPIEVPGMASATDFWQEPRLLFTEARFYGTWGMFFKDFACYLFAYHFGASVYSAVMQKALARSPGVGMAAAVCWVVATSNQALLDVSYDASLPPEIADWPEYFNAWYPFRFIFDGCLVAVLIISVGEGFEWMRLLGRGLVGTFLAHMYLKVNLLGLMEAARPGASFMQVLVVVIVSAAYVLTIGSAAQWLVVRFSRLASLQVSWE